MTAMASQLSPPRNFKAKTEASTRQRTSSRKVSSSKATEVDRDLTGEEEKETTITGTTITAAMEEAAGETTAVEDTPEAGDTTTTSMTTLSTRSLAAVTTTIIMASLRRHLKRTKRNLRELSDSKVGQPDAEKREDLLKYFEERITKDVICLYIDVMSTGKLEVQDKDVESFLVSKGLADFKLVEKKTQSTSTTKVYSLNLKNKETALKAITLEGEASKTFKITLVEIPSGKQDEEVLGGSDHEADHGHDESGDSELDDEEGEEEEGFVNEEGQKVPGKGDSKGKGPEKPEQPQA